MSDFFLSLGLNHQAPLSKIPSLLSFCPDTRCFTFKKAYFSLVTTRVDSQDLWGPFESESDGVLVCLVGRIAFYEHEWNEGKKVEGQGGLACKTIYTVFKQRGIDGLRTLNGGFTVILYDQKESKLLIAVDRFGMCPCFRLAKNNQLFLSSHPDILALAGNEETNWDFTSMAEFVRTGKVSYPNTYFKNIEALDFGCVFRFDLDNPTELSYTTSRFFTFEYKIEAKVNEWELADELSVIFRKAVEKRTLPMFGTIGIALSGGLDSRAILCSVKNKVLVRALCFFDEKNAEVKLSREIAKVAGVDFFPLKREFDYYGNSAVMGVRICGGMGYVHGNHFLGFRNQIKELGIDNLLSGKNCDWLFKGAAIDRKLSSYLGTEFKIEKIANFRYEYYYPHFKFTSDLYNCVEDRLFLIYPASLRKGNDDISKLQIAEKRIFPLYYEPDNAETVIPQRVFPWYLPILDNDLLEIYLKIPPKYKLNNSVWSKMVTRLCDKRILRIPNANTGVGVNASNFILLWKFYGDKFKNRSDPKAVSGIATDKSWPNWEYYIHHSEKIKSLWESNNDNAREVLTMILGNDPYQKGIQEYRKANVYLFLRLLTLKLWLDKLQGKVPPVLT